MTRQGKTQYEIGNTKLVKAAGAGVYAGRIGRYGFKQWRQWKKQWTSVEETAGRAVNTLAANIEANARQM